MLDYGELTHYFCLVHFHHALGNFVPIWNSTYIVKHGRGLSKWNTSLHFLDEPDAAEIHIIIFLLQSWIVMNTVWSKSLWIVAQLACTEQESEVLVVIETPHSMWSCWLQKVVCLDLSHQHYVSLENLVYQHLVIIDTENSNFTEAIKECKEIQLMAGSIIYSLFWSEWFK